MTELDALRLARSGRANYATDRLLTELGNRGLWELQHVGDQRVKPYVAHGNFDVDSWGIFRSNLTPEGERRLAELEAEA